MATYFLHTKNQFDALELDVNISSFVKIQCDLMEHRYIRCKVGFSESILTSTTLGLLVLGFKMVM